MFLNALYPRKKVGQNDLFGKIKVGKTKVSNESGQNDSLGKMKVGKNWVNNRTTCFIGQDESG